MSDHKGANEEISPLQLELLALMGSYKDLYYPEVCPLNLGPEVRRAYCLHIFNHVLKANSQVLAHNAQLREQKPKPGIEPQDEPRDQGLTRPKVKYWTHTTHLYVVYYTNAVITFLNYTLIKNPIFSFISNVVMTWLCQVLILVPLRSGALQIVHTLISLLETKGKKVVVNNKKRFKGEFGEANDRPSNLRRPDDYSAIFTGNVDDHFRIGTVQQRRRQLPFFFFFFLNF